MKTIRIGIAEMARRISRFRELKPLPIQNASIPEKARDVVYARKLLSVIGLEGNANTPPFRRVREGRLHIHRRQRVIFPKMRIATIDNSNENSYHL